jgi:phage shock protein PspC (stress-responsive transcriptional regulator)
MEEKRLVRSRDRWLGGICGGIGEYMGWSKDHVRLAWLLLTLFTAFSGLIIYIILWIVMPAGNGFQPTAETIDAVMNDASPNPQINKGSLVVGLILIGLGALGLIHRFVPAFNWQMVWPIILIVLGLVLLIPKDKKS